MFQCEPIHGWGFRRGGYQCRCKPGVVRRPYLGEIVERVSAEQYYNGFDCAKIGWNRKIPIQLDRATYAMRKKYLDMHYEYRNFSTGSASFHTQKMNIVEAIKFINGVNERICKNFHPQDLILHGDISHGAKEAKIALRLANFISAFLQISDPNEVYTGKRVANKRLTEDQMIGETLAMVMGNTKI